MMWNSVRARLTLWYVFVFGILLLGFSIFVYFFFSKSLYERLDHALRTGAQATATEFQAELEEYHGDAPTAASETLKELQLPGLFTVIIEDERVLAATSMDEQRLNFLLQLFTLAPEQESISFQTVNRFETEGIRLAALPLLVGTKKYLVTVAEPLRDLTEQLATVRRIFYIGFPATLLITGGGGFLLARKSLSPVVEMSGQAKRMSATSLQERLPIRNPQDELGQLAEVFNELLARLESSFEKMRGFMADASHELRTPLAIIRGEADVALSQDRDNGEYKEALAVIQDEAKRLSRIVDDMLALARADAGQHPMRIREFYLNDLVEEACRAMQVLASPKGVSLVLQPSGDIAFRGDEDMLRRLILNLLDNAVKYTPAGGSVCVTIVSEPAGVKLVVADTGVGIPAEAAPHVFERFFRVDKARSRAEGGSGLGLSIAKWVAEAHNGSIDLVSQPGQGSIFTVLLRE